MSLIALLLLACRVQPAATSGPCKQALSCMAQDGSSPCPTCDHRCQLDYLPAEGSNHIEGTIDYAITPPAGGPHNQCWYDFGVHAEVVPDERWVHNLEHGAIVFLYNCPNGCDAEVTALTALAEELGDWVVMSPYPDMQWRFATVAWEHRMLFNCLDVDVVRKFYSEHVDNGPESVLSDPAQSCMD